MILLSLLLLLPVSFCSAHDEAVATEPVVETEMVTVENLAADDSTDFVARLSENNRVQQEILESFVQALMRNGVQESDARIFVASLSEDQVSSLVSLISSMRELNERANNELRALVALHGEIANLISAEMGIRALSIVASVPLS